MMKRRDALKAMGGIAGAAALGNLLPGCGDDGGGGPDAGPVNPTMVFLLMENRSYDHYFGARAFEGKPGNGLTAGMTNPNRLGVDVPVYAAGGGDAVCVLDPPHEWASSREQVNGGAMDGFLTVYQNRHDSNTIIDCMSYLTRDHLPAAWALADHYVSCDQWFCSVLGPTWPNRMYWHSGTSRGTTSNSTPAGGFSWESIYHRLISKNVEYGYYYGDVPVLSLIENLEGNVDRIYRFDKFFQHAAAGTLAPVVYIDPSFSANDDHPPHHTMLGQQLIAAIYTALATSPQWSKSMLVITYDEHGGYFDHVAPPATAADDYADAGFDQYGVRVPALVIGPYVKAGVAVSTLYDHASPLKHIENMFELDPLNTRVSGATDLTDCIDLARFEAEDPRPPADIPPIEVNESDITDACRYSADKPHDHIMLQLADRYPEKFKGLDRRAHVRDYLYTIGDYLEQHNRGRIRRGR
jgi:phospholipase C